MSERSVNDLERRLQMADHECKTLRHALGAALQALKQDDGPHGRACFGYLVSHLARAGFPRLAAALAALEPQPASEAAPKIITFGQQRGES